MQQKATSIESLMQKNKPQQRQKVVKKAIPAQKKYVAPHPQPYVDEIDNTSQKDFVHVMQQEQKNLSFLDKIKKDKDTMDLIIVASVVFVITNSSVSKIVQTKFPSAYKEGVITLQGNFLLAVLAVIGVLVVRKLI